MSGKTVLTAKGLALLQDASVSGSKIKPTKFKVSSKDIELYHGIEIELTDVWYEAPVTSYRKVSNNAVEFRLEVPSESAKDFGRVFALCTDDGEVIALAKPPYPFPPALRQVLNVQVVWQALEEIIEFKYLPSSEYEQVVLDWNTFETAAQTNRLLLASGIITTPYNHTKSPLLDPADNPHTSEGSWTAIGAHNHPNYRGMPGLGQLWVNTNGYIFQTRHNDYRLYKKKTGFLEVEENLPPQSPSLSIDGMKDLFKRYIEGELHEDEKGLFRWDLTYLEAFFFEVDSPFDVPRDLFSSFRHAFPEDVNYAQMNDGVVTVSAWGYKTRFENYPFVSFFSLPNGKYAALAYRILTEPLTAFNGKRWWEFLETYDIFSHKDIGFFSALKRFRFRSDVVDINKIVEGIPGLDGVGAQILNWENVDGEEITGVNFAYYHRRYNLRPDAVNLSSWTTGINDPNLFVAHTSSPNVFRKTSYLIPLELVLRTPLETWNPYGIPTVSTVSGDGLSSGTPYSGRNEAGFWFFTPAELFAGGLEAATVADTNTSPRWVKDSSGVPRLCYPSGIWIVTPGIDGVGHLRTRFPIAPDACESGIWGYITDRIAKQIAGTLGQEIMNLSLEIQRLKGGR
jgi:hypothetical protein